ncbi:MAG: DUF4175 domain-containing protein [Acidobacteriota bacterium]|nr:DUF4175 domain-containing protein [Acidobacteriota bacterium]
MPPERSPREQVLSFIHAVGRRRLLVHVASALALAAATGLILGLLASVPQLHRLAGYRIPASLLVGALVLWRVHRYRSRHATAGAIERSIAACRNLVITAEELDRHPARASSAVTSRVFVAAQAALEKARVGDVVPAYWIATPLVVTLAASVLWAPATQRAVQDAAARVAEGLPPITTAPVRVRIEPPAYTGRQATTLDSPTRIEALEGSRISFLLREGGRVRFGNVPLQSPMVARESGYFAVESEGSTEQQGRLLIPLNVIRDRVPTVRIDAPGRDLYFARGDRTVPVTIHAADDLSLAKVELRYTKVSGTGEQFEFEEGALPVRLQRTSAREWQASGELALGALRLGPGDSLVYRAVAQDGRAGSAGLATSDTYFVEIAGPGQVALDGVDMPPELERYAMSQQMIVLKLERLRPRIATLSREALEEETAGIATEQRTVRANFVFLLGGHVEDEEVEAEHSHEIQEGRLENTARKDINAAISQMTRVEQGLAALNVPGALPPARAAVEALQRAFGKSRYLLRSLAVRSRLDPSRRLTGNLADAGNWQRIQPQAEDRPGEAARHLMDRLLDAAATLRAGGQLPHGHLHSLAESALSIDPAAPVWQEVAGLLLKSDGMRSLEEASARVAPEARRGALPRTRLAAPPSSIGRAFEAEGRR